MEHEEAGRRRLIQVTDVDQNGRHSTVLVTADPYVVGATERAVRERVAEELGAQSAATDARADELLAQADRPADTPAGG